MLKFIVRMLIWTVVGTALGFGLSACVDLLDRYPLINPILWLPLPLIVGAIRQLGLAPAGDAGFVVIPVAMVLQWTLLGFIGGLGRTWWLVVVGVSSNQQELVREPTRKLRFRQRLLHLANAHRFIAAIAGVAVLVAGYCVWQEVVLFRDQDFFLNHVDHKAVAEACFDMLSKPEDERSQQVALYLGADSRLPEAIRKLEPKAVSIYVDEISITKTPRHFYNRLTFRQSRSDTNRYDLIYEEGSSSPRQTRVYSMFAGDAQHATN